MQKTILGDTGKFISCIGLGTMYFGTKTDEKTSGDILDLYVSHGGSFLDTANKYASWIPGFYGGESEQQIGKWVKKRGNRQSLFIASKVGFPYRNVPRSLKKEIIISECEKSLKRLTTETIDLYFAHTCDSETPIDESMEAFYQLKKDGKIRFAGASNFYGWQLAEANAVARQQGWEGFCCLEQRHSYLEPGLRSNFGTQLLLSPEITKFCQLKNLSIIAYSPLLGGAYINKNHSLPVPYQSAENDFKLAKLREVSEELQVSPNAVVLAWMMQNSPTVIPLVAVSSILQLNENIKALSITLSEEQMLRLNKGSIELNKYSY